MLQINQLFISFLNRFPALNTRFNSLIESDVCLVSSFLDPRFGVKVFSADNREFVKARVRYHLALINPRSNNVKTYSYSY